MSLELYLLHTFGIYIVEALGGHREVPLTYTIIVIISFVLAVMVSEFIRKIYKKKIAIAGES